MPEHAIALRRAWELHRAGLPARRLDLPAALDPTTAPFRLARAFQRPPLDPDAETLSLRLDRVPGLSSLRLNGRDLTPAVAAESFEVPIEPDWLGRRNRIEIDVDALPSHVEPWGVIALVIRAR